MVLPGIGAQAFLAAAVMIRAQSAGCTNNIAWGLGMHQLVWSNPWAQLCPLPFTLGEARVDAAWCLAARLQSLTLSAVLGSAFCANLTTCCPLRSSRLS
jgi:hypothetical protein